MSDINYIPQVDYTSRDYTAIKADLLALIPSFVPEWTTRDSSDFGIALIELFSYMGDILNYYIDRSANEGFIGTASQRDSVLQIARMLGYTATAATPSTVTLTFYNSTGSPVVVPAGTQVATSYTTTTGSQIVFETNSAVTIPAKSGTVNGSNTVSATQGYTVTNEVVGTSTGEINQVWKLSKTSIIQSSISITCSSINFTQVPYLIDYSNYDPVFSAYTNSSGATYILFGDNVSGRVPNSSATIYATYRVGGGAYTNVAIGTITSILNYNVAGIAVSNLVAASGGADQESTDSIRINAPLSLKTLNRAVSLADYSALCKAAGVAKANATADVYSSVTVYFAPYGDSGVQGDGVTPSTIFNTWATTLTSYLSGKIPANTHVTFQPPSYVPVNLTASVTVAGQYKSAQVSTAVTAIITQLFAFDNVSFQDKIVLNDVMTAINSVPGVAYLKVNKLVRNDRDLTYTITNKASTGSVATLTTSVTHALTVGSTVQVNGVDSTYNGTFVVSAVTETTFSYALVSPVQSTTAASGSVTKLVIEDIVCGVNEIPTLNSTQLAITFTGGIAT